MLVDANILLYARDTTSQHHEAARAWLTEQLNGTTRVGLPWQSLVGFVRVATHPRVYDRPLTAAEAWQQVERWLAASPVWTPTPTERHAEILGALLETYDLRGNLVSDAHLAALAIEYGVPVVSADSDFARFAEVTWHNPLTG